MQPKDLVELLSRVTFDPRGEGALHLVVGGLVFLGVFMVLLVATAAVTRTPRPAPERPRRSVLTSVPETVGAPAPRALEEATRDPVGAWERGRVAGRMVRATTLDDVLDRMAQGGLGAPRVLWSEPTLKVVRLHACRTCAGARAPAADAALCHFERGFLEAAFQGMVESDARATETRCRARGDPACEFEVRYA